MIILVSASSRAKECAAAIEQKNHQETKIANSLAKAIDLLQADEYDVIVLDESFQQVEAGAETLVASHAGNAMPVYVNLSLHGMDRVGWEVSRALQRLSAERLASMRAAENLLRNELRGQVTAILLNSELALREGQLPTGATAKMKEVRDLAEQMRLRLEGQATVHVRTSGRTCAKPLAMA
jgi:chemotaxis response regulator CheB